MIRAIYPGSFDPVTLGHLDIIRRASKTVNELIVGVLNNGGKTPLFSIDERVEMLREVTADIPKVLIRGLRAVSDFEYELQMAQTNRKMNPHVDTMFLATSLEYAYLSSTTVKEVAYFDGDIHEFVPEPVVEKVREKLKAAKNK